MPHYLNPQLDQVHLGIYYRNFMAKSPEWCHVGLGVNALHTTQVLRQNKIRTELFGVWDPGDIAASLLTRPTVSHALIEAPWIGTAELRKLIRQFPDVHFIMRAHSEIGFLQVEPGAIALLREQMLMAEQELNFTVAANSHRLTEFLQDVYYANVLYLPNLYHLDRVSRKRPEAHDHRLLKIASFGALRWLKNHTTAAAVALSIAEERRCDLEFWVSVEREEHGKTVLSAVHNLFANLPWAKVMELRWAEWSNFRRTMRAMDLSILPSFTETFCLTAADSVAEGVPVISTDAIEWLPDSWKTTPDDIRGMVRIGNGLLSNPKAPEDGLKALETYLDSATKTWLGYFQS